jgi:hypothetical protein
MGAKPAGVKIGVMDTVFRMAGKPEAVGLAKKLGLEGMQVTLGRSTDGKSLPLEDASIQAAWRAASREDNVALDSTYLDMLHWIASRTIRTPRCGFAKESTSRNASTRRS